MRRVVIDMQNILFADAIQQALTGFDADFQVHRAERAEDIAELCAMVRPYALLMEVSAYAPWQLPQRLLIRDQVKQEIPDCKVVFVVDENTEKRLADRVRQAKKDGLIDNFIYGSISATYLSAVIDAL